MKKVLRRITGSILILSLILGFIIVSKEVVNAGAGDIVPIEYTPEIEALVDPTESTDPTTKIVNGDFSDHPALMGAGGIDKSDTTIPADGIKYEHPTDPTGNPGGVTENASPLRVPISVNGNPYTWTTNWRTTDNAPDNFCGIRSYFEWINSYRAVDVNKTFGGSVWRTLDGTKIETGNNSQPMAAGTIINPFVEMNSQNPATLYQDLPTQPGDIIYWSLNHAVREKNSAPEQQKMRVIIGDNSSNVAPNNGAKTEDALNLTSYTTYSYTGTADSIIDSGTGTQSIYGFTTKSVGLKNLNLTITANKTTGWMPVKGVYKVPAGQTATRFAFQSIADTDSTGNFLDDIVFETLLSNLKISKDANNNIIITGYWGDVSSIDPDAPDELEYEFKDSDGTLYTGKIDMRNIQNKDFIAKVPVPDNIKDSYEIFDVHPEGFPSGSGASINRTVVPNYAGIGTIPTDTAKVKFTYVSDKGSVPGVSNHTAGTSKTDNATAFVKDVYTVNSGGRKYLFKGWATTPGGAVEYNFDDKLYKDTSVYAIWEDVGEAPSGGGIYTPPTVTLNFDPNGNGGYIKPGSQSGASGFTGKVPSDIKIGDIIDGYQFTGWFKDKDGKTPFDFKTGITNNTTAYAGWEKVDENTPTPDTTPDPEAPVVKVEFETEIGVPPATQVEVPGNTAEDPGAPMDLTTLKPGMVINGYRFEGWYLDKGYTLKYDFSTPLSEDIVLYAKWTAVGAATSPKTGEQSFPVAASLAGLALLGGLLIITSLKRRREDIYS